MVDRDFYYKILVHEIEKSFADSIGVSGDVSWNQGNINKIYKRIKRMLNHVLRKGQKIETKKEMAEVTISDTLLKSIFRYKDYLIVDPLDPRQEKTLNKLAIFRGYDDWNEFFNEMSRRLGTVHKEDAKKILEVVRKANAAEFEAYKALPRVKTNNLSRYYIKGEAGYLIPYEILIVHNKRGWILNNEDNPSSYEIYSMSITKITDETAEVRTEEFWYLKWYDLHAKKYVQFYKDKGPQLYTLLKLQGKWKVKNVFYSARKNGGEFGRVNEK